MFEENSFNDQFKAIATHYKHEMSPPILKIYYEYLSQNLTEEEFMEALKQSAVKLPFWHGDASYCLSQNSLSSKI